MPAMLVLGNRQYMDLFPIGYGDIVHPNIETLRE
jgi:hypothetical protein